MRRPHIYRRRAAIAAATAGLIAVAGMAATAHARSIPAATPDDAATVGWATMNGGTDGGAGAPAASTYLVTDRAGLDTALDNHGQPDAPKIIYVKGTIHGDRAADGRLLGEQDYAPGYDIAKYLSCFGPDGWSDALHPYCKDQRHLRVQGSNAEKRRIEIDIPSNTTILEVGADAGFGAAYLVLHVVHNVVFRNLTVEAPLGYFHLLGSHRWRRRLLERPLRRIVLDHRAQHLGGPRHLHRWPVPGIVGVSRPKR